VVVDARVFKAAMAVRVSSGIAKRIAIEDGAAVEIAADNGMIYVRKAVSKKLSELIERNTPQNRRTDPTSRNRCARARTQRADRSATNRSTYMTSWPDE
jgi:antitoxin component of MazEF toxin-antitoxin module